MITNRLDNKEVLELIDKNKIEKIFLDIDYTILDFGVGNEKSIDKLNKFYLKMGSELNNIFDLILRAKRNLDNLSKSELVEYKKIIEEISKYQNNQKPKYWSRETMAIIVVKKLGLNLKASEIKKIRKIYWKTVMDGEVFYNDAIPFLEKIKKEKIPIVWVTGSDSVLKVKQVGEKIELEYDPEYSWKEKEKRLKKLLKKYPGELIIGDPIDKPAIWDKLFKNINIERTLVVGDSYETDLKPAEELGIKTVLIKRD